MAGMIGRLIGRGFASSRGYLNVVGTNLSKGARSGLLNPLNYTPIGILKGGSSMLTGLKSGKLSSPEMMKGIALTSMGLLGTTAAMKAINRSSQRMKDRTMKYHTNRMSRSPNNMQ